MDPGDVYGDLREADLTRNIAQKVIPHLKQQGLIAMAVPLDLPLLQRIDWINNTGYRDSLNDICLEIHINSGGKRGLEAWFRGEGNNNSQKLAEQLLTSISSETGYPSLGAHSEYEHELGSLSFLNRTNPVTVILETLFIDNDEDSKILKNDQKLDELAKAIAKGVVGYFGQQVNTTTVTPLTTQPPVVAPTIPPVAPAAAPISQPVPVSRPVPPMPITAGAPAFAHQANPAPVQPIANRYPPAQGGFGQPGAFNPTNAFAPNNQAMPNAFGQPGAIPPAGGMMQDREQRKEMIRKRYIQILGREPGQNDTNYFLNIGVTEDQLIKRMIDSQEHVDLVKAKQELAKVKEEMDTLKDELVKYKSSSAESKQMVEHLQQLMQEKNQQLQKVIQAMTANGISPDKYLAPTAN
jgi:hypothetical protein